MKKRDWEAAANDLSVLILGIQDATLMAENMVIAAESLGLGSCFLGAWPYYAKELKIQYKLPDRVFPVVGLVMGFPAEDPPVRPRYPLEYHLFEDQYPELDDTVVKRAMQVMDDALVRMKELAMQASTGTYSAAQRTIMNNEFQQMALEITRIAGDTKFNSIHLLDSANTSNDATIYFGVGSSITVTSVDVTASALGVASQSLSTAANAATALSAVDTAITRKDSARASFGYMMNRLESTTSVLNIQAENVMAAESRVSDVDVATEMASLTRNQVLAQAGVAMLSQANSMPQMALSLLR